MDRDVGIVVLYLQCKEDVPNYHTKEYNRNSLVPLAYSRKPSKELTML